MAVSPHGRAETNNLTFSRMKILIHTLTIIGAARRRAACRFCFSGKKGRRVPGGLLPSG